MTTAIEIDELFNRIYLIASLEDNWNDNGASKFSNHLINKVRNIIDELNIKPDLVAPTARDSIQLEYHFSNGIYLEFEIYENDDIKTFYLNENTAEHNTIIDKYLDINKLNNFVNYCYVYVTNKEDIILHEVDYNAN